MSLIMERQKRNHRVGRGRPAFTLVELLVVITIIGMLIALVMPTISYVKELGRRTQCISNQKQLGLAMLAYEGENKSFPGWQNYIFDTLDDKTGKTDPTKISWATKLLPYMDRNDLWKGVKSLREINFGLNFKFLKSMACPSDPESINKGGSSSYVANGLVLRDPFGDPKGSPPLLPVSPLTLDYISGADGTTNTLMLGENTSSPPTASAGATPKAHYWHLDSLDNGDRPNSPPRAPQISQVNQTFGFNIVGSNYTTALGADRAKAYAAFAAPYGLPLPDGTNEISKYYNNNPMRANISSNHGGGAVVCFCDGHVQFLRDDAGVNFATGSNPPITVYQLLVTPDGSTIGGEPPADETQFPQ